MVVQPTNPILMRHVGWELNTAQIHYKSPDMTIELTVRFNSLHDSNLIWPIYTALVP